MEVFDFATPKQNINMLEPSLVVSPRVCNHAYVPISR
jgi:hypothetical protein